MFYTYKQDVTRQKYGLVARFQIFSAAGDGKLGRRSEPELFNF
jgi:hypothetical protein